MPGPYAPVEQVDEGLNFLRNLAAALPVDRGLGTLPGIRRRTRDRRFGQGAVERLVLVVRRVERRQPNREGRKQAQVADRVGDDHDLAIGLMMVASLDIEDAADVDQRERDEHQGRRQRGQPPAGDRVFARQPAAGRAGGEYAQATTRTMPSATVAAR